MTKRGGRIYAWTHGTGGTGFYRMLEPLRGLQLLGWEVSYGPELDNYHIRRNDVILVHLLHGREESALWYKLSCLPANKRPLLVLDIDDDVWNCNDLFAGNQGMAHYWTTARLAALEFNMMEADLITTPSTRLASIVKGLNENVAVLPNCIPEWLTRVHRKQHAGSNFIVGYQGGIQHVNDLRSLAGDLQRFFSYPGRTLRIYGDLDPLGLPSVERIPWQKDVVTYLRNLKMDIGIAPLEESIFNESKSDLRAKEYMALGIPGLYTKNSVYNQTIEDGITGCLIGNDEWYHYLNYLERNFHIRNRISQAARAEAKQFTIENNAHLWNTAYRAYI